MQRTSVLIFLFIFRFVLSLQMPVVVLREKKMSNLSLVDAWGTRVSSRDLGRRRTSKPSEERSLGKSHSGESCRAAAAAAAISVARDRARRNGQGEGPSPFLAD